MKELTTLTDITASNTFFTNRVVKTLNAISEMIKDIINNSDTGILRNLHICFINGLSLSISTFPSSRFPGQLDCEVAVFGRDGEFDNSYLLNSSDDVHRLSEEDELITYLYNIAYTGMLGTHYPSNEYALTVEMMRDCTIEAISFSEDNELVLFTLKGGNKYSLCHIEDCCESVELIDVCGNYRDLLGVPLTECRLASSSGISTIADISLEVDDSSTWSFYRMCTIKGEVVMRWLGISNGYYSEEVEFVRVEDNVPLLEDHSGIKAVSSTS